jgi:hypothetical protein
MGVTTYTYKWYDTISGFLTAVFSRAFPEAEIPSEIVYNVVDEKA